MGMCGIFFFAFRQWVRANLPDEGGMTTSRASVLLSLAGKRGSVGMSALGEGCGLSPRSMTVLVDGLEKEGLVERSSDAHDRRITLIGLTEAGRRLAESQLEPSNQAAARLFEDLTEDEQAELLRLLIKLQGSLRTRGIEVPLAFGR